MNCCDSCEFYSYDEEYEEYYCTIDLDEDEYYRLQNNKKEVCPYYRSGDEYAVVRKQN